MTSPMSELDRRIGDVLREQPPAPPEMAERLRRADVWRTKGMTLAGHAPAMEKSRSSATVHGRVHFPSTSGNLTRYE